MEINLADIVAEAALEPRLLILKLLEDLRRRLGMSYLFVSHDRCTQEMPMLHPLGRGHVAACHLS